MNCKKIKKLLPLYVGGELNKKKENRVKKHLQKCENCRESSRLYLKTLKKIREIAIKDKVLDFNEFEWEGFKSKLNEIKKPMPVYILNWKKAMAFAFVFNGILIGSFYFYKNYFHSKLEEQRKEILNVSETISESRIKVCFILKETNTKVIWYSDKNFNLGGKNEL